LAFIAKTHVAPIIAGRVLIARRGYPATAFLGMYIFHVGARA
jgi:hypothetical protein